MHWYKKSEKNSLWKPVMVAGLLVYAVLVCPGGVYAVDTDIGVNICGSVVLPAEVNITQPVNDSTVNQSTLTIRGSVANAAQVEINIDGQYISSIAIGQNESTFQFDVEVPVGTHTVGVTANALCDGQSASDSIVITYTPVAEQPSTGVGTPTELEGTVTLDGESVLESEQELGGSTLIDQLKEVPVVGPIVDGLNGFSGLIGLESTINANNSSAIAGVARVGITVAALTSVVMAGSIALIVAHAYPGLSKAFHITGHRYLVYLGWAIRGAGLLAMSLAYFI